MNNTDRERFRANYLWFNQFFEDLQQLLESISKALVKSFSWEADSKYWYYEKYQYQPSLPPYYVTALSGGVFAVQIYAIIDTNLLGGHPVFENEISLVIVVHSRPDRVLWLNNYGLRVIKNNRISIKQNKDKVITGEFLSGESQGTHFYAFQVPLRNFTVGANTSAVVQTEIVDVLGKLPDW